MQTYQRYSTSFKMAYSLGLQNKYVDKKTRDQVPASTSWGWIGMDPNDILGIKNETSKYLNQDQKKEINIHPYEIQLIVFKEFTNLFMKGLNQKRIRHELRKNKVKIINFLDEFSEQITYKEAAKILPISLKTLYGWKSQVKYQCDASPLLQCVKRHSNQATIMEVQTIEKALLNPTFEHWSIKSCWAYAFKNGKTKLSYSTWSRYNTLLGFRKEDKEKYKRKSYIPIRASSVNEIWHADITVFKTANRQKCYIYTVIDNYSRYILAWRIETKVSGEYRLETIKEALQFAFGDKPIKKLQLITDGGTENNNKLIKNFIASLDWELRHDIALQDIDQSNSMQEAVYRTLKYGYLFLMENPNYEALVEKFKKFLDDYQFKRPHYALNIYTPEEVYNGADIHFSRTSILKKGAIERLEYNRNVKCSQKCFYGVKNLISNSG